MTQDEEITFRSDVTVELVRASASDADVIFAARVSTAGEQSLEDVDADAERSAGLINYLMRDRHGSPFEHNSMTFFVQAPIFVWREHMRHRIATYNEESGRYRAARAGVLRARPPSAGWSRWASRGLRVRAGHRRAVRPHRVGHARRRARRLRRLPADARRRARPRGRPHGAAGVHLLRRCT